MWEIVGAMLNEDDFRKFIETRQWVFAKTMPQWPHEYTVRQFQDSKEEQIQFEQAVAFIRARGQNRTFEPTGRSSVYFDIDARHYGRADRGDPHHKPRLVGLEGAACTKRGSKEWQGVIWARE